MSTAQELFIKHCIQLAKRGGKYVNSNPQVGAIIVSDGRIIGEGWHQQFGEAHAEINAFQSVNIKDKHLIQGADLYVTLEPCHSTGKTGPCSTAVLEHGIKRVFVAAIDPTIKGESLDFLSSQGVEVHSGIYNDKAHKLIEPFRINHELNRPFVILKYAQSKDYYIAKQNQKYWISNEYSQIQVHKWRSEVDGILIGVNTLLIDDPQLTTRDYPGESPRAIIIDPKLRSNPKSKLFQSNRKAIIFTTVASSNIDAEIIQIDFQHDPLVQILSILYTEYKMARVLVEGGAKTLKAFIQKELWDEARIITGSQYLSEGIKAPSLSGELENSYYLANDLIRIITPSGTKS